MLNEKLKDFGVTNKYFIPYGYDKGKIKYSILNDLKDKKNGKLILVTAINPTEAGEGKTTVSIGLADGLNKIGSTSVLALREPSLGPTFGLKGGATGGGKTKIEPELDINLHFNGDFHAITSAHNLLSTLIDNHIHFGNKLNIKEVFWPRVMDMNDRSLRVIETKIRKDNFIITAASEIMAIISLASDINDLYNRISNIVIGINYDDQFIYAKDIGGIDAITTLLKDAIHPNVVLTKEKTLALVHSGPFANIAHGTNSVLATKIALKLGDYVVTEAGFGADLGMEKFLDIKQPHLDKNVDLVVLVATINSLKVHGGSNNYLEKDLESLSKGTDHLLKHIENIKSYNLDFVIALNKYKNDHDEEIDFLINWANKNNYKIEISNGFEQGASGMINLAELVKNSISNKTTNIIRPYNLNDDPISKIEKIATSIYGANNVSFSKKALNKISLFNNKLDNLPVCIAKTPLSFSGNSKLLGRPKDFTLYIDDIKLSNGANFFVALTKGIILMPGLNSNPRAFHFNIKDIK